MANFNNFQLLPNRRSWGLNLTLAMLVVVFTTLAAGEGFAETRKLKLYFLHTGERAEITFKKNGRYIDSGLRKINRFLRDWRRNEPTKMDPRLLDLIWEIYDETGSSKYIHVVSGYRSPATNNLLRKRGRGVARKSQHTLGKAMDFFIPGVNLRKLRNIGLKKGLGGVGYYPKSGSPFVHMDTGRVRHWPRMSRKELVRVFPRGKTLHVPTDGKPLAKYNQAKAEYERKIKGKGKIIVAKAEEIEKRPSFFAKLLGRGEDEEGAIGAVSAPKPVATTKQPAVANTAAPAPAVETPEPQPVLPEPVTPPQTPETVLAALPVTLVPVPVLAPRAVPQVQTTQIAELSSSPEIPAREPAPEDTGPKPTLGLNPEIREPEAPQTELALAAPVPAQRPVLNLTPPATANPIDNSIEQRTSNKNIKVAALSPTEIEDLRKEVYTVLNSDQKTVRPVVNVSNSTFLAINSDRLYGTSSNNRLSLVPRPNPKRLAELIIDQQVADVEPIEPGTKSSEKIGIPESNPRSAPEPEIITASLQPLEPGARTTGELAFPEPSPAAPVKTAEIPEPVSESENPNIPIPVPAHRPILVAAVDQDIYAGNAAARKLESLQTISLEERILGKWALASDSSIADIAEIRPPAYARNVIRELPSTVLSRGFVREQGNRTTSSFSGSSIEFLDFTKFKK
ncbi:MAG: DUF882 domain-containing protein [Rhizobiaceae bacterium]